jgi:hypothetical protein
MWTFVDGLFVGKELGQWYPHLNEEDVAKVVKVYKGGPFRDELERVSAAIGEPLLRCGVSAFHSTV